MDPKKDQRGSWMKNSHKSHRNLPIPRVHWILLLLHTQLLQNCTTTPRSDKESYSLAMDRSPLQGVWRTEDAHVPTTCPHSARFPKVLLFPGWHLCIQPGGCTLTTGNIIPHPSKMLKTSTTSHSILLSHVHSHWTQLWHLWAGTTSCDAIPSTLEMISRMDKGTLHHPHWPQELAKLEVASEAQQTNSKMARRFTRIWLWNPIYTWENK